MINQKKTYFLSSKPVIFIDIILRYNFMFHVSMKANVQKWVWFSTIFFSSKPDKPSASKLTKNCVVKWKKNYFWWFSRDKYKICESSIEEKRCYVSIFHTCTQGVKTFSLRFCKGSWSGSGQISSSHFYQRNIKHTPLSWLSHLPSKRLAYKKSPHSGCTYCH